VEPRTDNLFSISSNTADCGIIDQVVSHDDEPLKFRGLRILLVVIEAAATDTAFACLLCRRGYSAGMG
jgi:hypothetical protein